ncbi:DUF6962 family protein [Atopomonas sediminilitoris]|uniref:DUF6962 family protein n=1 Tax=Atopomonas sediminilitoris TaxID=2919919 RepID=UPI001F4EDE9E|nr:hypothetical protein [Atopomonas sediminilitoris]MCJ8169828.1 hypothetical protein [Atopomonas sediminilitoris]
MLQPSTFISDGLLALVCAACAVLALRQQSRQASDRQPLWFSVFLGFALTASAATLGALRYGPGLDVAQAHSWLSQASSLLGLPLIALAALVLGRRWTWEKSSWGRAVLGFCAFFELARQAGVMEHYRMVLNLLTLGLLLYASALRWPEKRALAYALSSVGLLALAGLWVGTRGTLGPFYSVDVFHALLILAYPLILALLLRLSQVDATELSPRG